ALETGVKTVYLLRHATAQPGNANTADFDRPLADNGVENAHTLNQFLITHALHFKNIHCSSALRTRQTHDLVLQGVCGDRQSEFSEQIYHACDDSIVELIKKQANTDCEILIIGHNPTIHRVYERLSRTTVAEYPPGTLAALSSVGSWCDITTSPCVSEYFLTPYKLSKSVV
ncbi:MAG: histidine phosphatase family protein, partial [Porticoccaceae bacterium]|nr:histidine phosphatase family protein [Porticoccaceae bacterium]